jgi:hypothetical protein
LLTNALRPLSNVGLETSLSELTIPNLLKTSFLVRFQILAVASMKIAVFWNLSPRSLVEINCFRGAYCLHHLGDESHNIQEDSHLEVFYIPSEYHRLLKRKVQCFGNKCSSLFA